MEGFAEIDIDVDAVGGGKVLINGEDVSRDLVGLEFQTRVGAVPTIAVYSRVGGARIRGQGVVRVVAPGQSLVTMLNQIDPKALEREALSRQQWNDNVTFTEQLLQVLMEAANAAESESD